MHDRQIAATALVLANKGNAVQLLTCDQNITESGLVAIVWYFVDEVHSSDRFLC